MDEINDILSNIGLDTSTPTVQPPSDSSYFSDNDISEIISENTQEDEEPLNVEASVVPVRDTASEVEETNIEHEESLIDTLNEDLDNIIQENGFSSMQEEEEAHEDIDEEEVEEVNTDSTEEHSEETSVSSIPLNSPTLLIDSSTARFSGATWYDEIRKAKIILAGLGGIGSNVAFQLARMAPANIVLYDDDTVERVNMAGQLFSMDDIGKFKVNAIANMMREYTSTQQIMAIPQKFLYDSTPGDIMICGFDNMKARRTFFDAWMSHVRAVPDNEKGKCLYIDGRLSIDTLQVLCIKGDDEYNIMRYNKKFLFADYEADATVCSLKQTTYLACMIGSFIVNLFTNFIANQLNPVIPYDLPFFTEYDAQNVLFKTES